MYYIYLHICLDSGIPFYIGKGKDKRSNSKYDEYKKEMTKYSETSDEEEARNLIFFPDGHLRYRWEQEGAILL